MTIKPAKQVREEAQSEAELLKVQQLNRIAKLIELNKRRGRIEFGDTLLPSVEATLKELGYELKFYRSSTECDSIGYYWSIKW